MISEIAEVILCRKQKPTDDAFSFRNSGDFKHRLT